MRTLVEVCITEPELRKIWAAERSLDSPYNHPLRLRYVNYWLDDQGRLTMVGSEGSITPDQHGNFIDNNGNHATVIREIDRSRYREADRFVEIVD